MNNSQKREIDFFKNSIIENKINKVSSLEDVLFVCDGACAASNCVFYTGTGSGHCIKQLNILIRKQKLEKLLC